jgi:hypothetical protein
VRQRREFPTALYFPDLIYPDSRSFEPAFSLRRATTVAGERSQGSNRVIRGGSWNNDPQNCRSANRNRNEPGNRNNNLECRLALAPPDKRILDQTEPTAIPSCLARPGTGEPPWTAARCKLRWRKLRAVFLEYSFQVSQELESIGFSGIQDESLQFLAQAI